MITGFLLLLAYILPLPLMAACYYFGVLDTNPDFLMRLLQIGMISIAPSAIIMVFVLKRILHLVFNVILILAVLLGLNHFGLIHLTGNP